jgi:hypothetical protein
MCENPWLTFFGFFFLLVMLDNVAGNVCRTVLLVAKSKAKKDNEQNP